jgi:hypothetical protein
MNDQRAKEKSHKRPAAVTEFLRQQIVTATAGDASRCKLSNGCRFGENHPRVDVGRVRLRARDQRLIDE